MGKCLLRLRKAGTFICACAVVVLFCGIVFLFVKSFLLQGSALAIFEAGKLILLLNLAIAVFVVIGNLLFVAGDEDKATWVGNCGICGMFSVGFFGFVTLFAGLAAGRILLSLALFYASLFVGLLIYVIARYVTQVLRHVPLKDEECDEVMFPCSSCDDRLLSV